MTAEGVAAPWGEGASTGGENWVGVAHPHPAAASPPHKGEGNGTGSHGTTITHALPPGSIVSLPLVGRGQGWGFS